MPRLIAPSLLSADFLNLGKDVGLINESQADWIHCDVMDGVFVPNISFGLPVVKAVKSIAQKPLDVHLMIVQPERYITAFKEAGADMLSVHFEACNHLHRVLQEIRSQGMKAGVVLNPHSPVQLLEAVLEFSDFVLLMSVNPGFGGQTFISNTYRKIEQLREMIAQQGLEVLIEVDGGVGVHNSARLFDAGADVLVGGNAVFNNANPKLVIEALKKN